MKAPPNERRADDEEESAMTSSPRVSVSSEQVKKTEQGQSLNASPAHSTSDHKPRDGTSMVSEQDDDFIDLGPKTIVRSETSPKSHAPPSSGGAVASEFPLLPPGRPRQIARPTGQGNSAPSAAAAVTDDDVREKDKSEKQDSVTRNMVPAVGANVDVSPRGSWLAWFRQLRSPSPVSLRRVSTSSQAEDAQRIPPSGASPPRARETSLLGGGGGGFPSYNLSAVGVPSGSKCLHCGSEQFSSSLLGSGGGARVKTLPTSASICGSCYHHAPSVLVPYLAAYTPVHHHTHPEGKGGGGGLSLKETGLTQPTQSTVTLDSSAASSGNTVSDDDPKKRSRILPTPPPSKRKELTLLHSDDSDDHELPHHKTLCGSRRVHQYFRLKRRRVLAIVILLILLIAAAACIIIFAVIPSLIKKAIENADLHLVGANITNPTPQGFDLALRSEITRKQKTPVQLSPFVAEVYYESRQSRGSHTSPSSLRAPQADVTYNASMALLRGSEEPVLPMSEGNMEVEGQGGESSTPVLRSLGQMALPGFEMERGSTSTSFDYTTRLNITDLGAFGDFERELVARGSLDWVIAGKPSVVVIGLTYRNIPFRKSLPVRALKLTYTPPEFLRTVPEPLRAKYARQILYAMPADTGSLVSPAPISTDDEDDEYWWSRETGSGASEGGDGSKLELGMVNLTMSTQKEVRLGLQLSLNNSDGFTTLSPLGALRLQTSYKRHNISLITSDNENAALRPGLNFYNFYGTIPPTTNPRRVPALAPSSDVSRKEAMGEFISALLRGERVTIETRGLSCSTPLYEPAIASIHLYKLVKFGADQKVGSESGDATDEGGVEYDPSNTGFNSTQGESEGGVPKNKRLPTPSPAILRLDQMIHSTRLLSMQLFQPREDKELLIGISGTLRAVIGYPLGPEAPLKIPSMKMKGIMAYAIKSLETPTLNPLETPTTSRNSHPTDIPSPLPATGVPLGHFEGELKGAGAAGPVYGRDGLPEYGMLGNMPVVLKSLDFTLNLTLDISEDDGAQFGRFSRRFVQETYLDLSLQKVNSTILTETPLGSLVLVNIPMNRNLQVKGFGGLKGIKLESFHVSSGENAVDMVASGNISFGVTAVISFNSDSGATMNLGSLKLELRYNGRHLSYMSSSNSLIKPGHNLLTFTGVMGLGDIDFRGAIQFLRDYISRSFVKVEIEFIDHIPGKNNTDDGAATPAPDAAPEAPAFVKKALVGYTMSVQIPGRQSQRTSDPASTSVSPLATSAANHGEDLPFRQRAATAGLNVLDAVLSGLPPPPPDTNDADQSQPPSHLEDGDATSQQTGRGVLRNFLNGLLNARQGHAASAPASAPS